MYTINSKYVELLFIVTTMVMVLASSIHIFAPSPMTKGVAFAGWYGWSLVLISGCMLRKLDR